MTDKLISSVNNWKSLKASIDLESKKVKGDAFELLTKLYFKVAPKFQDLYDDVWLLSEVPSKVLEELGIPSHDLGIDLILRSGKEYHAVQCKYHSDKSKSVTFSEVATFISLVESNDKITQGYICSTAELTSKNFNKLNLSDMVLLMSDTWESLDEEFFSSAKALLKGKKKNLLPFKPRAHQTKALKQADKYFNKEKHTRGKLIFPCGAGKSLTGFWLTQKLASKSTLIAVPSLSLVKQTLEVYLREIVAHKKKVKWLCICSDEGIGKNDDVVVYTQDLGVPCVTDPEYIENWLAENVNEEKVVFTTYQSGRIIAEISKKLAFTFDVGIFDEAHKTVGSDKKLFSHLLFSKNISIAKRIFMTATERFYEGSKDDIISMDDEDIYGDTFALMSFKEAIELQLLTDYKVITIDIQKSEIADFIRDNNLVQLNDKWKKETEARSLASMLALRKAMKRFNIKNAVSFHSSIEKARRNKDLQQYITDTYDYQPIDTYTVSGKDATTKRNDIVQEFAKSDKALITNARCLTEGVDVPNIDCIVFADPRKSRVDIVQALGRALRKKEGKEWGYVILPVIYDNTTNEIDNDNFNEILDVVRGLAANDERIVEYFKDKGEINTKAKKEVEEQFNFEVFSEYMDEGELSKQLQIKVWEKLSKFNYVSFEEARKYARSLNLKSESEWRNFIQNHPKPRNIPNSPRTQYASTGFIDYPDFLGYTPLFREFISYSHAKKLLKELNIKSRKHFVLLYNKKQIPYNIPKRADSYYKTKGWISWSDFLANDKIAKYNKMYWSYDDAKSFVHKLKLKTGSEWKEYCKSGKKPQEIPSDARNVYKNKGWISTGDFLGTGRIADQSKTYRDFNSAKEYVKLLYLKNRSDWREYCKSGVKPEDIPSTPWNVYKNDGWNGIKDWLGFLKPKKYKDYKFAKEWAIINNIRTKNEWKKSKLRPFYFPANPDYCGEYSREWKSWKDFLETKVYYLDFYSARELVRTHKFKAQKDWVEFTKAKNFPRNVHKNPSKFYAGKGWVNMGDWLGNGRVADQLKKFKSFSEVKTIVKNLRINTQKEWFEYVKSESKPDDIPYKPYRTYKDEWVDWYDFLGKTKKERFNFEESKSFVKKLKLKSSKEYFSKYKTNEKLVRNPQIIYKNKGWKGWKDFLGND